jgi:hypothetical protein
MSKSFCSCFATEVEISPSPGGNTSADVGMSSRIGSSGDSYTSPILKAFLFDPISTARSFWRGVKQAKAMCASVQGEDEDSSGGERIGAVQCLINSFLRAWFSGDFVTSQGSRTRYDDEVLIVAVMASEILGDRSDFEDVAKLFGDGASFRWVSAVGCWTRIWIAGGVAGRENETTRRLIWPATEFKRLPVEEISVSASLDLLVVISDGAVEHMEGGCSMAECC